MKYKNILVTGGAGFIGSHLVNKLVKENYNITVIDNLYKGKKENISNINKIKFVKADIRNFDLLKDITKDQDIIFHLASQSDVRGATKNPDYSFSSNVIGTYNVLQSAKINNVKKIIFSSSREVYGNAQYLPVDEKHPINPFNLYGATKASSEHLCNIFKNNFGLNIIIFRLANVYGHNDVGRVIPIFIDKIKNNESLPIYGGKQILDFVWIDDVINIFFDSIENNKYLNDIFNIGSGIGTSIGELSKLMIKISNKKIKIKKLPRFEEEVDNFIADIKKIGVKPIYINDGLKKLMN